MKKTHDNVRVSLRIDVTGSYDICSKEMAKEIALEDAKYMVRKYFDTEADNIEVIEIDTD